MATTDTAGLASAVRAASAILILAACVAACDRQEPRTFNDFMDDSIARDGALARCNQDLDAALSDIECANARRAAAAVAVLEERARAANLTAESERKLLALRQRVAAEQEAERLAAAAAAAAEAAQYEAQWQSEPLAQDEPLAQQEGFAQGEPLALAEGAPLAESVAISDSVPRSAPAMQSSLATQSSQSTPLAQRSTTERIDAAALSTAPLTALELAPVDEEAEPAAAVIPRPFRAATEAPVAQ